MKIAIFISIILLGCILSWFRYIAVWNKYKHMPTSYHEVLIISCGSWLPFLLSLVYYRKGDKFLQTKLDLPEYYNFDDKNVNVTCVECGLVHKKGERVKLGPKFWSAWHCPKCNSVFMINNKK